MKFRTEVDIPLSDKKIEQNDLIFSIGSCFATEFSHKMSQAQAPNIHNPFGTLFQPIAMANALDRIAQNKHYQANELMSFEQQCLSLDHHSQFNHPDAAVALQNINQAIQQSHQFIKQARWAFVTLGTALVYEFLPSNRVVANCHKIPQKYFSKRYLNPVEIAQSIAKMVQSLRSLSPDINIVFSISPVRHTKEGITENMLSKANLLVGLQMAQSKIQNLSYLPIYEIMMDDLRDYRFYKEDMIHPSQQAIDYIWAKFQTAYIAEPMQAFMSENCKIQKMLQHQPKQSDAQPNKAFLNQCYQKIQQQQSQVNYKIFAQAKKNLEQLLEA
jgi:GSCFA family